MQRGLVRLLVAVIADCFACWFACCLVGSVAVFVWLMVAGLVGLIGGWLVACLVCCMCGRCVVCLA